MTKWQKDYAYDALSKVLTDYEEGKFKTSDEAVSVFYEITVLIQRMWEELTGETERKEE